MLVERPAYLEAAEAEADDAFVPFRRHIIGLERNDAVERGDGVIEALEIGKEIGAHGQRIRIVGSQGQRMLTALNRVRRTAELTQQHAPRD